MEADSIFPSQRGHPPSESSQRPMSMRAPKINTSAVLVFSLILVSSFIFLVIKYYQTALSESISYHQQLQSEMAKSATTSIDLYFQRLGDDLQFLSQLEPEDFETFLKTNRMDAQGIKTWFTTDSDFQITHLWGDSMAGSASYQALIDEMRIRAHSKQIGPQGSIQFSSVYPVEPESQDVPFEFLILYKPDSGFSHRSGALGLAISFDWLMERFVTPLKLGDDDFAWVMDNSGRLIYHPRHTEMLLENIKDIEEECAECHSSFKIQEEMVALGAGRAEYLIQGEPEKIMAYAPIEYRGLRWILAISTYSPSVVRDVLKNSISIFILSGVFLVLLIITGGSLYYLNLKRIRAHEAQKSLRQVQRIQEKLDQASKLASLGELIDSVAHEINTPTGIISIVTDGILMDKSLNPDIPQELHVIKNQVQRIRKYTKRLLGYSRVLPFAPSENDIVNLIEECLFLLGPRLREKQIEVVNDLPQQCPEISFDRPRLEQVIINLVNNSIDSVEAQGMITIRLENEQEETDEGPLHWVILSIQDNGAGISPGDMLKVFEPFFSNKTAANGTGLGLSISKSIVDRHGGRLEVASKLGQGATFSIYLPTEGK